MSTLLVFAVVLGTLSLSSGPSQAEVIAPNILFILADDMGQWAARLAIPYVVTRRRG